MLLMAQSGVLSFPAERVAERLRLLLPDDWSVDAIDLDSFPGAVELVGGGEQTRVDVAVLSDVSPRAATRLSSPSRATIVFADWWSPRAREVLRERGFSSVDATGNVDVVLSDPTVVLRAQGADRNPSPPSSTKPTLRGPRAWALMRTLVEVASPYTAGELAACVGIDDGYVSKVLGVLVDEGLVEREPRRPVTAVAWESLLRSIATTYSLFDSNDTSTWVAASGPTQLLNDLSTGALVSGERFAVSGSFAVDPALSVAAPELLVVYCDQPEMFARTCRLLPAKTGANVLLAKPYDPVVYARTSETPDGLGVPTVSTAQVVLDLLTGNARMPEQGEALLTWMRTNEQRWQAINLVTTP